MVSFPSVPTTLGRSETFGVEVVVEYVGLLNLGVSDPDELEFVRSDVDCLEGLEEVVLLSRVTLPLHFQ